MAHTTNSFQERYDGTNHDAEADQVATATVAGTEVRDVVQQCGA
jgi:hypothetical protein